MNKWLKKGWALSSSRCSERLLCMLLICGIAITLVPVLWIGIYDVPCADDYSSTVHIPIIYFNKPGLC